MGMGQGVVTGVGHGDITCVLQTQFSSIYIFYEYFRAKPQIQIHDIVGYSYNVLLLMPFGLNIFYFITLQSIHVFT